MGIQITRGEQKHPRQLIHYFENSIEFMMCESRRQCTKISKGINAMNTEIPKCLGVLYCCNMVTCKMFC